MIQTKLCSRTKMNYISVFVFFKIAGAQLMNCPQEHVKFEKIIGLRPSSDVNGYLLYKRKIYEPVALECLSKCSANVNCFSFVILYNISECYWYDVNVSQETESVLDPNVVWFEKTCLDSDCDKLWIFERIPGTILIGYDVVTLPRKVTRSECQQNCLNYTNCRSARFRISDDINLTNTLGTCMLSEMNRNLVPNSFRAANYNEEYFENQCVQDKTDAFCAYEEYDHVILSQVDMKYDNFTKQQCQKLCDDITFFNCRGYSLIPSASVTQYLCLIHSTNSKVHGPRMLYSLPDAHFFEKARCLNITVTCTETHITVNYQPDDVPFNGKIYMSGYSENIQCYMIGNDTDEITLKIPLHEDQCGITKAVTVNLNRTLLSGTMILQYNPVIQTQGDRVIKIGCIFNNDAQIVLGTGVNFANSSYLNRGTSIVNTTTVQPTVEMRVVDFYTKREVGATQVGQELQLVIELQPPDGAYDIWAARLLAMSENGEDSIVLLDDRGCATNPTIFPNLLKVYNNETRRLVANFNAFKFTSSSIIRFSITVQFCPTYCTLPNCNSNQEARPKIRREIQVLEADVKEVIKNQFDNDNVTQMPLEFVLLVRNSKIVSNPLVYDENKKIIIAGYDLSTNEVCVDFSLTIGIIVTWIGVQIILLICGILMIKKYKNHYRHNSSQSLESLHKNFGLGFSNLGNRRVRWADSGSYR